MPKVNRLGAEALGYEVSELLGRSVLTVFPDEVRASARQYVAECAAGSMDALHSWVLQKQRKDGSWLWVKEFARLLVDREGRPTVLISCEDITERVRQDAALRSSGEMLRQALQASNTGLWDWNTETHEVWFSKEWKRQLGYEEEELADTFESWESRLHPDDHDRIIAKVRAYLVDSVGDLYQEFRLRHRDGNYRWIEARASIVTDPNGRRVRLLGSHTDITERKQAHQTLRRSEERFRSLFENSPVAYQSLNREGRYIDVNERLCHLLGYEEEELIGREFGDFGADDVQGNFPKMFKAFKKTGKVRNEITLRRRDDSVIHVMINGRIQRDQNGEFLRTHCILTDITERARAEDAVRRSEARLNEAQRLAHIGSWELHLARNCLNWSDEIYRIFEIDRDSFGGSYEAFLSVVHPDDRVFKKLQITRRAQAAALFVKRRP